MMFKTHLALGLLIGLLFIKFFPQPHPILFVVLVVLFSSLPDLDTEKSKLGRKIYPISLIIRWLFGHRGFVHSMFAALFFYFTLAYFNLQVIGDGLLIGYLAHLIGDASTKEGVAFLYPFSKFRVQGFMATGGVIESFILVCLMILNLILLFDVVKVFLLKWF
ncbi:MAG: metal-dependent hydrolase [Candidatus Nanoarchaeia archaeon]